ncbi:MAG: S1C family serine protease [Oscillospiraceae bacterium]|nr:S1C family serine protease [Oscillospiraceae bacterium]
MVFRDTSLYPYSTGSGIIISEDGYIVTNAHVLTDVNAGLKVVLENGEEYKAEIVGQDSRTDIAVIKIEAEGLTAADLGDSDQLELGEMVVAIGNAGGYSGTLTVGYVSGLNREVKTSTDGDPMTCIQTDAAMSPGVSGGALINMYGQVVGITSSKYKSTVLDEGIGFAITTQFAKPIIEDIISQGYISGRVRVGITYTIVTDDMAEAYGIKKGIIIQSVDESCDIAKTDLQAGDIMTELNGQEVYSAQTIKKALEGCEPGDIISAHIYRKGVTEDEDEEFDITFELMQDTTLS